MSNPAKLLTLLSAIGLVALSAPGASGKTSVPAAEARCSSNSGPCVETNCEWFGDGCWNEKIFELVVSGKLDSAPRHDTKMASTGDGRSVPTDRRPPAVWVSFHIGGF
jgi:hypothetical protein